MTHKKGLLSVMKIVGPDDEIAGVSPRTASLCAPR